ncbi:glutathione S-transferase [Azorhizobium oxalatiphilum]|uniref:Glutathione S-transferase n=1 Tax=Azorhizobium oxalatiphilum TaxID=980631 RepID=A0A917FFW7_9HYPH|nr:glutathione S-transferase [Azorhizobium oxalatiphilum]GGF81296.1 glutathione S-transferase [Azorhizobium oxalatiphilum]
MLKIYGRRNSSNVQKVMWLVGELDLPHEHIPAGGPFGLNDTPEFRAVNPHGKVPVIDHDGCTIWESHTILRYLAATFGAPAFWPQDAGERSLADRWMDWALASLNHAFINEVFWTFYRTPEAQRDWPRIKRGLAACEAHMTLLDRWLADRPFMIGSSLSPADIAVGTPLYRYFNIDIERPPLPNVEAYYARLTTRPAYAGHVMVDFADLYGRQSF